MKLAPTIPDRAVKPLLVLAAVAAGAAGPIELANAEADPIAVGQTTTLMHGRETLGTDTGVLIDYSAGNGIYCPPGASNENDMIVGSDMADGVNMGPYYGHTAFMGLLAGQTSDAYYSIKAGWALHREADASYSLFHFDTQNYKTEKDKFYKGETLNTADMVGQKVASLSLWQLLVQGSGRWTDGQTEVEITPDTDTSSVPLRAMTQFYFKIHVQCSIPGSTSKEVPQPDVTRIHPQEITGPTLAV
jgi:hypothetical protein